MHADRPAGFGELRFAGQEHQAGAAGACPGLNGNAFGGLERSSVNIYNRVLASGVNMTAAAAAVDNFFIIIQRRGEVFIHAVGCAVAKAGNGGNFAGQLLRVIDCVRRAAVPRYYQLALFINAEPGGVGLYYVLASLRKPGNLPVTHGSMGTCGQDNCRGGGVVGTAVTAAREQSYCRYRYNGTSE